MENIFYKLEKKEDLDRIRNDLKKRNDLDDFFFSVKMISNKKFYKENIEIIREFKSEILNLFSKIRELEIISDNEMIYDYVSNSDYFRKTHLENFEFENKVLSSTDEIDELENVNVMTFGTFDLFHIGHEKIINNSNKFVKGNGKLFIGVSSDRWNELKGKVSIENEDVRLKRIKDKFPNTVVFFEDHNKAEETWPELYDKYNIDLIVMGGDHIEKLNYINNLITPKGKKMRILFFERTPNISTTNLKKMIR